MGAEAFELDVTEWVNSPPVEMTDLRGKVVLVEAFQMLCPGCVTHGIPQAQRVQRAFDRDDVVVLGLHTVFEHHDVMTPGALRAFVQEYRITFPVAVDRPIVGRSIPSTMDRYSLQGTPSLLLLDKQGQLRHLRLGQVEDLALGTMIGRLLSEEAPGERQPTDPDTELERDAAVCRPGEPCA